MGNYCASIFRSILTAILIFAVGFQPTLLMAQSQNQTPYDFVQPSSTNAGEEGEESLPTRPNTLPHEMFRIASTLEGAPTNWIPSEIPDTGLIAPGRQVLRIFEVDPNDTSKDRIKGSEMDLSEVDASIPTIPVPDPSKIKVLYNDKTKELAFVKFAYSARLKRDVMVAAHVIKGVESPIKTGEVASRDKNLFIVPLKDLGAGKLDGLRTALWPHVLELMFKAPISLDVAVPSPDRLVAGAKIVEMNRLSPELSPRTLVAFNDLVQSASNSAEPAKIATQGDVVLTVQLADGAKVNLLIPYHEQLLTMTRNNLLYQLAKAQVANPELQDADALQKVLLSNQEVLTRFMDAERNMLASTNAQSRASYDKAQSQAFRAIATSLDLSNFTALLSGGPGQDGIQQLIDSPHFKFEVNPAEGKFWAQTFSMIEREKTKAKVAKTDAPEWDETLRKELGPQDNARRASADLQTETAQKLTENVSAQTRQVLTPEVQRATSQAHKKGNRFIAALKKMASPKTALIVGTGVVGGVAVDVASYLTGGMVMRQILWGISSIHESVLSKIPGEEALAEMFSTAGPFLQKNFALVSVFMSIAFVMTFPIVAKAAAKAYSKMKGFDWSAEKALFTYGIRLGGRANYPYPKILWDYLGLQKNLYLAHLKEIPAFRLARPFAGVPVLERIGIPWFNRGVWNAPWNRFSSRANEAQLERMSQVQIDEATRHQRALLIAATIVSQVAKKTEFSLDPASLIALMNAEHTGKLERLLQTAGTNGESRIELQRVAQSVAAGLARLKDEGVGKLTERDEALIYGYLRVARNTYSKVAGEYSLNQTKGGQMIVSSIHGLKDFMHAWAVDFPFNKVLNFALFYKDGYKTYLLFKDFEIDDRNAQTSDVMMKVDYNSSAVLFGIADAPGFGGVFRMDPVSMFRIPAEQIEQTGIWTTVGGVDAVVTNPSTSSLSNISVPLSEITLATDKAKFEGNKGLWRDHWEVTNDVLAGYGTGERMSVGQAITAIAKDQVNPEARRGMMDTQMKKMKASLDGFQMRFLLGVVPRAIAIAGVALVSVATAAAIDPDTRNALQGALQPTIDWLTGQGVSNPDSAFHLAQGIKGIQSAPLKQANVLLNKMAILIPSLAIGYAVIWGPAMYSMNVSKDAAEANRAKVNKADAFLEQGVRLKDVTEARKGLEEMMALYESNSRALGRMPTELRMKILSIIRDKAATDTMVLGAGKLLYDYRMSNPPLPTVHSHYFEYWVNLAGAAISTILFVNLSRNMYDPTLAIGPQLAKAAMSFGGFYMALKTLNPITRSALRFVTNRESRKETLSKAKTIAGAFVSVATEEGRSAVRRGVDRLSCMLGLKKYSKAAASAKGTHK